MLKFLFVIFVIAILMTAAQGAEWRPANRIEGLPYQVARERLISEGAKPSGRYRTLELGRCGTGRELLCRRYPEIESCSSTGWARCAMYWLSPQGRPFWVGTAGERDLRVVALEYPHG